MFPAPAEHTLPTAVGEIEMTTQKKKNVETLWWRQPWVELRLRKRRRRRRNTFAAEPDAVKINVCAHAQKRRKYKSISN